MYVPEGEYSEFFLPAYARDIQNGVEHFIIERTTDRSRWFADFDCPSSTGLGDEEWEGVVRTLQETIISECGKRTSLIALKVMGVSENEKTGIHVVAPDVVTTMQTMLEWRERMICSLQARWGHVAWEHVFDEAVYKGGSLRMAMSSKMVPCTGEQHDARCCAGKLRVNGGRRYEMYMFFDRDGVRSAQGERVLRANMQLMISKTSIRHCQPSSSRSSTVAGKGGGGGGEGRRRSIASLAPPRAGAVRLDEIVADLPREHVDLFVVDDRGGRLRVSGSGERHCSIVGREHRSSSVYYVVDDRSQTATQRCWCRKGECRVGRGPSLPLRLRKEGVLPPGFVWG